MFEPHPVHELTIKVAVHGIKTADNAATYLQNYIDGGFAFDTLEITDGKGVVLYEPEPIKEEEAA